jgi:O-antigen/teichoic acid export membrane protein
MESLKNKAFTGIRVTSIATILIAIIQIAQIAVLSRFLEAKDFGLMAILMVVVGFSQSFIDMGISNAIIHKKEITNKQLSTLYWLNIITSIIVYVIILIITPYVSNFYTSQELNYFIPLIAIALIIQSFGQQFQVLLQKDLQFNKIAYTELYSKLFGLIIAILLAYYNFGIYSLIFGVIIPIFIKTIILIYLGLSYHKPIFYFNLKETKFFINFGFFQMGERMIYFFNSQIDIILIGKLLGNDILGLYSLAKQFVMRPAGLITPVLSRVMFPIMAKKQNDILSLQQIYIKIINVLSSLIFPLYGLIIIFSHEIVILFFGEKWLDMQFILQLLAIYAAIRSVTNFTGPLVLATGKIKRSFVWNLVNLFLLPICIYFGAQWEILGICYTLIVFQFLLIVPNYQYIIKPLCNLKLKIYLQLLLPVLLFITILTVISILIIQTYSYFLVKAVVLFCFTVLVFTFYYLFNNIIISYLKELIIKRKIPK